MVEIAALRFITERKALTDPARAAARTLLPTCSTNFSAGVAADAAAIGRDADKSNPHAIVHATLNGSEKALREKVLREKVRGEIAELFMVAAVTF